MQARPAMYSPLVGIVVKEKLRIGLVYDRHATLVVIIRLKEIDHWTKLMFTFEEISDGRETRFGQETRSEDTGLEIYE
jgi:hypothetical protein